MIPKFRAWLKDDKKMIANDDITNISFEDKEVCVQTLYFEEGLISERDLDYYGFDEIILMQSTGLFDKNGQEVFVGDIIRCTRGCPHEVYLEKEYGGTYIGGMPAIYLKDIREGYAWTGDEEIVGNVYQNPELLEADHDR